MSGGGDQERDPLGEDEWGGGDRAGVRWSAAHPCPNSAAYPSGVA